MRFHNSRWFRWGLGLSIVLGLMVFGHYRLEYERHHPYEARSIVEQATVAGFIRTGIIAIDDGDNPPLAEAYFIGPAPKPDVVAIVSVPTIQLQPVEVADAEWVRQHPDADYAVARGERPDGCGAGVSFFSNPTRTVKERGTRDVTILTDEQIAAVRNHTAVVIKLSVGPCGW
ncbi:hypothetical protein NS506_05909 [Nocardia seriolae]|uniref:Uncharacterized protein n=1 Tax=Nocardia seriolae TaxID=37332 RepID=A0ABC8B055_9NOCA|nr:hypothetical protein NS506_05909 [Nocardia seriolae]